MVSQQRMKSSDNSKAGPRDLRVVAIGGGTGLSTLLKGLKRYVLTPPLAAAGQTTIRELCGVVTVSDDGGSSGRLRKEFNMLPPGEAETSRRLTAGRGEQGETVQNAKMMKQLQEMQSKVAELQEELGGQTVTGTAGGGAVEVVVDGVVGGVDGDA